MLDALSTQGISFTELEITPFCDDLAFTPTEPQTKQLIPMGTTKLVRIARDRQWTGVFFDPIKFRVDTWLNERDDLVNQSPIILSLNHLSDLFIKMPKDEVWFIRPVEDLKAFNGTVTTAEEIARFATSKESGNFQIDGDTVVAISYPQKLLAEWRWFIVDGQIITGSKYRIHGQKLVQREMDPVIIAEAQALAGKWMPHPVCVMDTAQTESGMKVLEFNCFNSSGFYQHDVPAIFRAVSAYYSAL